MKKINKKTLPTHIPGGTCKARINYPCSWQYKIIGEDRAAMQELVASTLADRPYTLTLSNVSRSGRYVAMNLELTVDDEEQRLALYRILAASRETKVVI
ncbi:MAG: DUF493 domain-containing protein [Desulfobulbaceae bacterium]|nr:DUF493 domain-containing protein [Desulfobulbaceae bacterium]